jgi:hypothetical protein
MQLQSEVLDWHFYSNRRKIACLAGMVPSEWSTGEKERRGSITKVGVPAIRRIIVEMVWRMVLFQPQYQPVQKWQEVLRGSNPALKKKGGGGYWSAADRRSMADGNWTSDGPRTQPGDDRRDKVLFFILEDPPNGSHQRSDRRRPKISRFDEEVSPLGFT